MKNYFVIENVDVVPFMKQKQRRNKKKKKKTRNQKKTIKKNKKEKKKKKKGKTEEEKVKKGEAKKGQGETKGDTQKYTKMPFLGKNRFFIKDKGKDKKKQIRRVWAKYP